MIKTATKNTTSNTKQTNKEHNYLVYRATQKVCRITKTQISHANNSLAILFYKASPTPLKSQNSKNITRVKEQSTCYRAHVSQITC